MSDVDSEEESDNDHIDDEICRFDSVERRIDNDRRAFQNMFRARCVSHTMQLAIGKFKKCWILPVF